MLTSASTDTQVEAAYDDNADYDVPPDTDKARAFVQACRFLLRRRGKQISMAGRMLTREEIQDELAAAVLFYRSQARGLKRTLLADI